eukprot:9894844-Alexandrium_andersonii.AAC.1
MSASLVGSEMCIRDRPAHRARALGSAQPSCRQACAASSGPALCPQAPVSYTHLTLPTICSV